MIGILRRAAKGVKAVGLWIRQMEFVKIRNQEACNGILRKACGYEDTCG